MNRTCLDCGAAAGRSGYCPACVADRGRLFPRLDRESAREIARRQRAARREARLDLCTEGQTEAQVSGEAWIEASQAFFGVREEQPKLF
jgi:hypothetical protein